MSSINASFNDILGGVRENVYSFNGLSVLHSDFFFRVGASRVNGVLSPAPEPETYALMLVGLGAIGWACRRRATNRRDRRAQI